MGEIRLPETLKEWIAVAGVIGGLVPLIGGAWALSDMLHKGSEAYAQVGELKDDVRDLEKRYNNHIESAWKKYKIEQAEKARENEYPPIVGAYPMGEQGGEHRETDIEAPTE